MLNTVWSVLGLILVALLLGSAARLGHLWGRTDGEARRLRQSLGTWWCLAALLTLALVAGRAGMIILLCAASLLGMREYAGLIPARAADRRIITAIYIAIVLNYIWIYMRWDAAFVVFLPGVTLVAVCAIGVLKAETRGFLHGVSSLYLGAILLGYFPAHAAALTALPEALNRKGGAAGWTLFLIFLTAANDIVQSVAGKRIGRHKITPKVSPNKTWEGMLAGVATTIILGVVVGSMLTPLAEPASPFPQFFPALPYFWAGLAAMLIGVGGFFGDVTLSAIKRDLGVKDSGTMLPGQGGILDRLDSLTFSAPLFYWYVCAVYGA